MIIVRSPSGDTLASAVTVRTPSGDKAVARMALRTPAGDRQFYVSGGGVLAINLDPVTATGSASLSVDAIVTTSNVTATVTGATPPLTYSWAFTSGNSGWTILSPNSAATRFSITVPPSDVRSGDFTLTVTDARGRTGTAVVNALAYNFGGF